MDKVLHRNRNPHFSVLYYYYHFITLLSPLIHTTREPGTIRTDQATMLVASPPGASSFFGRNRVKRRPALKFLASQFPNFLPPQVDDIQDSFARNLASRIQRLPVNVITSSSSSSFKVITSSPLPVCLISCH